MPMHCRRTPKIVVKSRKLFVDDLAIVKVGEANLMIEDMPKEFDMVKDSFGAAGLKVSLSTAKKEGKSVCIAPSAWV